MLFPYDYLIVPTASVILLYYYYSRTNVVVKREEAPRKIIAKKKQEEESEGGSDKVLLKIFFGSQTGTAEDFAKKVAQESKQWGFRPKVIDLEDYTVDNFKEDDVCLFVLATYGEGEPTDNARDFWTWLNDESQDKDTLSKMRFFVFGLGNKTYEHYNEVARVADKRLEALGGKRICPLGEGDDDSSLEEDFLSWKEAMWPEICSALNIEATGGGGLTRQYKMVQFSTANMPQNFTAGAEVCTLKSAVESTFLVNEELHGPTSDRSCRHIEIEAKKGSLSYEAGDHIGIYPINDPNLVAAYIERLQAPTDLIFKLEPVDSSINKSRFPPVCSLQTALSLYCDLTGYASKKMVRVMAEYATDAFEKDQLMLLAGTSPASKEKYGKYVKEGMKTVLEVMNDYPSVRIPIDHFLEEMPALQCRFYSISSSPLLFKDRIHVTAVLAQWTTPDGVAKRGVCTNYLLSAQPGQKLRCFVRKSTFRLPRDIAVPVIMVGPGTGLAPFRGFVQDRHARKKRGDNIGPVVLYFGCRNRTVDFLYESELMSYGSDGTLAELHLAFSREKMAKEYVQHKMKQNAESVYKLLVERKGYLYVCGEGARMAKDVQKTLLEIIIDKGGMEEDQARSLLTTMQKQSRYQQDVWS